MNYNFLILKSSIILGSWKFGKAQEKPLLTQKAQVLDLSNYNSSSCRDINKESTMFMECLDLTDAITSPNEDLSCEPQTSTDLSTKLLKRKKRTPQKNTSELEHALLDYIHNIKYIN